MAKSTAGIADEIAAGAAGAEAEVDSARLRADIDRLKADLSSLRDNLGSYGAAKASQARSRAESQLHELQGELDRLTTEFKIQSRETAARVERQVHEKPFQSLLIAAGLGFVLAHLLRR